MALPFFAVTLFVSAFLLFLVQPMMGKMLLPRLGGTPQVWNTCMVFFQMALLAGYAYTHAVSSRLKVYQQLIIHGLLLLVPFAILLPDGPFNIYNALFLGDWTPPPGANPIGSTLLLLALVVGLPFFVVATSAPLLQRWFANTGHPAAKDPYFLYGASNLGSMLALIAYPVLVEPTLHLRGFDPATGTTLYLSQPWIWTFGYVVLVGMVLACAAMVWTAPPSVHLAGAEAEAEQAAAARAAVERAAAEQAAAAQASTAVTATPPTAARTTAIRRGSRQRGRGPHRPPQRIGPAAPPSGPSPGTAAAAAHHRDELRRLEDVTWMRRLRWVGLAFVPSSMMLGIITYMSTDVSAIPLFWVIPLALYLLSFILVFLRWPVPWTGQPHTVMTVVQLAFMGGFIFICLLFHQVSPIWRSMALSLLAFFFTAMVCHGELARDRPGTKHLTEFYLWMSVGGMFGGMFNAIIAPVVFWGLAELPVALVLAFLLRPFPSRLVPLDKGTALIVGGVAGFLLGIVLWAGVFPWLVCVGLGILLGLIYQPAGLGDPREGWTERWMINLFPGLGEWAQTKGEELARGAPAAAPGTVAAAPRPVRSAQRPNYYVLSYTLDIIMPVLLFVLAWVFVSNGQSIRQWLLTFGSRTLGMSAPAAREFSFYFGRFLLVGVPALLSLFFFSRPLRFALGLAVVLVVISMDSERGEITLWRGRSYFGIIRVLETTGEPVEAVEAKLMQEVQARPVNIRTGLEPPYHYLMHGTTHHGLNYQMPDDLRRLATTYYHELGPVGVIMDHFNWFKGAPPGYGPVMRIYTHYADARMPTSIVALGGDPLSQLVNCWSEPPYACVGLGTGTMSSYSRPFQHMTFYEIDDTIRNFHLPPEGRDYYFNYVHDSIFRRGAGIEIIMGDARFSMSHPEENLHQDRFPERGALVKAWLPKMPAAAVANLGFYPDRESYYHCIELDAFSSDAIPVHLITQEAIKMYFTKIAPNGVLMVHTSNRHVDLVSPVTDVAKSLNLSWRVAKDGGKRFGPDGQQIFVRGLFSSEYVMLARRETDIVNGRKVDVLPPNTPEAQEAYDAGGREFDIFQAQHPTLNWYTPRAPGNRVWTDDYSNLIGVFRWGFGY